MVKERRKPVLGRVVPGVTPDTQRRLRGFFAFAQAISNSLAARLALLMFCTPPRRKLDPADAPILERATRSTLRCGKDRFTIFRWEHAGPAVVLLHGWGSHAARFADFVAPLHAAGFSVIGIDAPAHGTSPGRFSDLPRFRDSLAEIFKRQVKTFIKLHFWFPAEQHTGLGDIGAALPGIVLRKLFMANPAG